MIKQKKNKNKKIEKTRGFTFLESNESCHRIFLLALQNALVTCRRARGAEVACDADAGAEGVGEPGDAASPVTNCTAGAEPVPSAPRASPPSCTYSTISSAGRMEGLP